MGQLYFTTSEVNQKLSDILPYDGQFKLSSVAGNLLKPTPGPNGVWKKRYNRMPRPWVANENGLNIGDRRIVAHNGGVAVFDQTSTTDTNQYWVLTCVSGGAAVGSTPPVVTTGDTVITDGGVVWHTSPVIYMTVAGTGTGAGTSAANSRAISTTGMNSALVLFRTGQTFPQSTYFNIFNTYGTSFTTSAGTIIPMMFSWFGPFGAGLPIVEKFSFRCNGFEAFQIHFGGPSAANTNMSGKNQRYYGCKFTGSGSNISAHTALDYTTDWPATRDYGYFVIDDCEFNGHTGGIGYGYDGLYLGVVVGTSFDSLIIRNCTFNNNGRHGLYIVIGGGQNYTDAATCPIKYFEFFNNDCSGNGTFGANLENANSCGNYDNRPQRAYIAHNQYKDNGQFGAGWGGIGNPAYPYLSVIRNDKATGNMLSETTNAAGQYNLYGVYSTLVEGCYFDNNGSGGNIFDGVGLYLDVLSSGDSYVNVNGCRNNIVRYNKISGALGWRWFDDTYKLVMPGGFGNMPSAGITILRGCGNQIYGNIIENCSTGTALSRSGNNIVEKNIYIGNISVLNYQADSGTNIVRNNFGQHNHFGLWQNDERIYAATGTYTISDDTLSSAKSNSATVKTLTATTGVIRTDTVVNEINGPGVAWVQAGTDNSSTAKILIFVPFSKTSFASGELEFFLNRNLTTWSKAAGSIINNTLIYALGDISSAGIGNTWPVGFTDKLNYCNGLINEI